MFRRLFNLLPPVKLLIGEDTDLIVLLYYHAILDSHDVFFCPEPKKNTKKLYVWNIRVTKESLVKTSATTPSLFMLFDTTSCLYRIGKGKSLSMFKASSMFREQAKVFNSDSAPTHDVLYEERKL